ncbi:HAD-IIA family hydrolase [Candidatus Sumerlaeota bacterium]|nr:HAD-IIA family hydrolase [Candidatus Sumerlaeota bacterium]
MSQYEQKLKQIRHVTLDMDGTIYKGSTLFEFTQPFLQQLQNLGIGYTFLTNNSSKSVKDYVISLNDMGVHASEDQIFTSTLCAIDYLRDEFPLIRHLYVLGTQSLREEFRKYGFDVVEENQEPEAVIVGFDTSLVYERLCRASWWISQGKTFIATHPDFTCPTDQPTVLVDCGSFCRCIEAATGVTPHAVLGKPDHRMLTGILKRHNLEPNELAMCGDRIYTDMAMARSARCLGVLALTGEATEEDAVKCAPHPDLVVPNLEIFGKLLAAAQQNE